MLRRVMFKEYLFCVYRVRRGVWRVKLDASPLLLLHRSQNRRACHWPELSCLPLNSAFSQKVPQLPTHKAHALETVARLSLTELVLFYSQITGNKSCFNLEPIIRNDKGSELVRHWCNVFSSLLCQWNGNLCQ